MWQRFRSVHALLTHFELLMEAEPRETASVGKRTPLLRENSMLLMVALVPCSITMAALRHEQ